LDLRDKAATEALVAELKPEFIIHQAVSPRSPEDIAAIVPAARHVMDAAIDHNVRLIHISTDLVFDGLDAPYGDDAPLAPVNEYAAAKAFAEDLLMRAMPDEVLIVRPSLIYGFDPIDKQTGWIIEGIRKQTQVRLFTNEIRCPIWVDTLSLALLELASLKITGRLNLAGLPLTRWDFGMKMLALLGIEPGSTVQAAVSTPDLHRPADLTVNSAKARSILKTPILTVDEAFAQHVRQREIDRK
jgi:dTDP-4-dehydrorhamnose reductase